MRGSMGDFMKTAKELAREFHCRYCAGDGFKCEHDMEHDAELIQSLLDCLAICQEIANDPRVDQTW